MSWPQWCWLQWPIIQWPFCLFTEPIFFCLSLCTLLVCLISWSFNMAALSHATSEDFTSWWVEADTPAIVIPGSQLSPPLLSWAVCVWGSASGCCCVTRVGSPHPRLAGTHLSHLFHLPPTQLFLAPPSLPSHSANTLHQWTNLTSILGDRLWGALTTSSSSIFGHTLCLLLLFLSSNFLCTLLGRDSFFLVLNLILSLPHALLRALLESLFIP